MIRWIYDLGFFIFGIFSLPRFLVKLKQAEKKRRLLGERFGFLARESVFWGEGNRPLWIHCVSVGEVLAIEKFLHLFREKCPAQPLVLTTVTPTGQRIAKQWEGERVKVVYFPFDFRFAVRRFFETLKPLLLLLVETEIWPNVLEEARRRRIPVGILNGRLSERSFQAFRRFSVIFNPLLRNFDFLLVQSERDRERWLALGVDSERVHVTGNMKLDALDLNGSWKQSRLALRERWGFLPSDQILIGGSTHPGEEEILLRVLRRLREERSLLKLLLAPRHIERSSKLLELVRREGFRGVLASRGAPLSPPLPSAFDVLILDLLGELRKLYPIADAVFMGGSLIRHGGQNPIEPASSHRPIIHGPWVFNFEALYERLDGEGGSLRVKGEEELLFVLRRILASEREREHLGKQAYEVVAKLRGASERNLNWVEQFLKQRGE